MHSRRANLVKRKNRSDQDFSRGSPTCKFCSSPNVSRSIRNCDVFIQCFSCSSRYPEQPDSPRNDQVFQTKEEESSDSSSVTLGQALWKSMKAGNFSDISLFCSGVEFPCHRVILGSRSNYFKTLLTSNFKEADEGRINIEEMDVDILRIILEVMYTDKSHEEISMDMACQILEASDRLAFEFLKDAITTWILQKVTPEISPTILGWFKSCNVDDFQCNQVKEILTANIAKLVRTKEYAQLMAKYPNVFLSEDE